ncbi:hypothetical protein F4813DRAFT_341883 [Daldinia decipiens]|uniref:uncharacterized protein n=1 Tax=Daldinia decipiens TaxID=326647 RepID=UPI0020C32BBC|nr:uncharacterized protein F4813DRAFT_341883 [Daldinia decipiens]KAI1662771.1 hypothetical protein F4813DRAFT_341883 [Daldinia decipiens]
MLALLVTAYSVGLHVVDVVYVHIRIQVKYARVVSIYPAYRTISSSVRFVCSVVISAVSFSSLLPVWLKGELTSAPLFGIHVAGTLPRRSQAFCSVLACICVSDYHRQLAYTVSDDNSVYRCR